MPRSKKNKPNNSALKIDTCNINVQPTETTVDDEELQVRLATAKAKLQKVQEVIDKLDRLDPEKCPENKTPIDVPADTPTNISPKQTEIFSDQFLKSKVPEKNENPESLSDQIKSKKKKNRNKKNKQNENENINDNDDENIQNVEKEEVKPVQETINQDVNQSKRKPIIVDATTVVVEPVKVESNNNSKKRNKKNRNKTNTGQENVETKDSQELSQNLKTASLDDTSFKESPKLVSLEIKSETLDIPVKDEPKIVVQKENSEKLSQKKIKTEKLNSSAKKEDTKNLENDSGKLLQQEVKPEPLIDRPVKEDSKKENTDNTEKDICAVIWNILDEASFTNEAVTSTKNKKKQKGNRQPPQTEKAESIQDDKQPKELLTDGNAESQSEKPVCANKSEDDYVGNKSVTEAFANPIKKDKQQNQHNTVDTIALQNQKTTAETVSTLPAKVENIKKPNDASKSAAVEVKETLEPKLITDTEKTELKTNTNSDEKDNKSKHKHHGKKLKIQDKKGESSNPLPNLNESSIKTENTSTENIESKTVVPNDLEKQPTEILAANENKKGSTDGESITLKPDIKASDVEIKNKNLNVLEKKQTEIVPADTKQIAAYLDKDVPAGSKKKDNKNAKHNNEKNKSKSDKETADKVITAASANIVEKQDNIKQHEVTQKVNETVIKDESKTLESVAVETSQPKPEEYVKPAMEQDRTNDVKPPADSTTEKKPSVTTTNRGKPNKQTVEEKLESGNVESSQPKPKESVKPPMEQDSKTDAKNPTTESITKNKPSVTTTIKEKPNKKPAEKILESAIVEISQPKSEDLKQSGNEKGNESVAMEPTESINVETKSPVITTNKGHPSKQAPKKILDSVTVESGQQKPQESPKQTTTEIGNKPEGKRLTESALPLTNKEQPNKQTSKKTPKEIEAKLSLKSIGSETIDPSITTQKDNESEPKLPLETVTTEFTQQSSPITIQEEPSNQTSEKKGSSKHNNHKEQHQKGKQTEPKKTEPLITLPETETGTSSDNSTKTITQSTEGTAKNSQKDCEIIKKEPSLILNDWTLASNQEKGKTVKSTTGTPPVSHEEKPVKPNDNKQKPNKQKDKHNQKQAPNSPKSCAKSAEQTTKPKPIKPDNIPEGKKNDPPEPDIGKPLSLESIATGEQQPSITDEESLFDTDSKNAQGSDFAQSVEKSAKSTDEAKSLETVDQQQQPLFEQFRNDKNVSPTTNKRNKNLANAKQFEKNSSEKNTPQLAEKTAQEKMNASQTSTVQLLDILDAKMSTPEKNRLTNTGAIRKVPKDKKLQQNSPATVSHDLSSETNSKSKNQKQKSSSEIDAGIEEKLAKKLKEILSSADSENKQNSKLNLVDILASVNGLITNKTSGDKNSATKISSPPPTKAPPPVPNVFDYEDEEDFIEYKFSPRQVFVCTVCQVCKETVGKLMPCGLCRMVSYCGEKHLDEDRAVHLAFCMAIQEIAKKRGMC